MPKTSETDASRTEEAIGTERFGAQRRDPTHTGDFFGVPATGTEFTATAVSLPTFKDGQPAEYLVRPDALGVLQQLGAVPS